MFLACIPLALWFRAVSSATFEVDDTSITYRRGENVTRILWSDVRTLENRRSTQRLKVFSASGAVINVEHQVAGFDELAAIIAARSGRSIDHLSQPTPKAPEGNIEIAPPAWFRYSLIIFVPLAAYFFCIRFVLAAWQQHNAGLLIFAVLGGWLTFRAARQWWVRLALRLRMDDSGIHLRTRRETVSALWGEIRSAELEHPEGNTWFVVRDRKGEPVIALKREFFNWTGSAMKRFDELAAAARHRTVRS